MWNIRAIVNATVADGHGTVGLGGDAGVVCDKHDGFAALLELMEGFHHKRSGSGVQVSRRLVGQNDGRVIDEGARDCDALHLAARELGYAVVPVVDGQRDSLQRVHGAHFALATGHIGVGQRQHHIFDNRQARQQVEALKDKANAQGANFGELLIIELGHVEPLQVVVARRRLIQTA